MASAGAHLTSTVGDENEDGQKPSIFDILAQENLVSSLSPALKYGLKVLAENRPATFGWLYRLSDELYSLLDLILEHYCLKHYSASFAENFYGLKRVVLGGGKLTTSQRLRSLAYLVMLPYIKEKCDHLYEQQCDQTEPPSRLRRAFVFLYPYLHSLHQAAIFFMQLAYVFNKSNISSPWLWLVGVRLATLTDEDIKLHSMQKPTHRASGLSAFMQRVCGVTAVALSSGLSVAVFFLQFIESWYSSDQAVTSSLTSLPQPSPPQECHSAVPKLASICPLCQQIRTNDTALAVSGYVFCYPCIYKHVQRVGCCPVTSYPANTHHLIRLYTPQ